MKLKPKFHSRQQAFKNRKQITLPLSEGGVDAEGFAELLSGYEHSDNFKLKKHKGYITRNADTNQIKVVPWGNRYVVFSLNDFNNDFIDIHIYNETLNSVVATIAGQGSDFNIADQYVGALKTSLEIECYKDLCGGEAFDDYFVFNIGSNTFLYSKSNYFAKIANYGSKISELKGGAFLVGETSGAKGQILAYAVDGDNDVQLDKTQGVFQVGENVRMIVTETQEETINVPAVTGSSPQDAYSYVQTREVIVDNTKLYTVLDFDTGDDGITIMTINDPDNVQQGEAITTATATETPVKLITGLKNFNGYTGVAEFDRNVAYTSNQAIIGKLAGIDGHTKKSIHIANAPKGTVIGLHSFGSSTHLFIGNLVDFTGSAGISNSTISYSAGHRVQKPTIPFFKWGTGYDISRNASPAGFATKENDGGVKQILSINGALIVLREKGITAYRFEPKRVGNGNIFHLNQFFTRDTEPYKAISTPYGTYFTTKDGLYKLNITNSGGRIDKEVSDILGDKSRHYNFKYSSIGYNNKRLYILINKCNTDTCSNSDILVYMINKDSFFQLEGWAFNDIYDNVAVSNTGGTELFTSYEKSGVGLPTKVITKEYKFDRGVLIDAYYLKWLGGSHSDITITVKGRNRDGVIITLDNQVLNNVNNAEVTLLNNVCNSPIGDMTRSYNRIPCHDQVESIYFEIESEDDDPHELVELGIDYTLGRNFHNC